MFCGPRIERAQQLYWEMLVCVSLGRIRKTRSKLIEMAQVHEERARDLLAKGDPEGWVRSLCGHHGMGQSGLPRRCKSAGCSRALDGEPIRQRRSHDP